MEFSASPIVSGGSYLDRKRWLHIIIFGSYHNLARLTQLKHCLIVDGYDAKLVMDFTKPAQEPSEDNDVYNLRKSLYWVERSSVSFFVFFKTPDYAGATIELTSLCDKLPDKIARTTVFYNRTAYSKFTSLLRGLVKKHRIWYGGFLSDKQLCELARGRAFDYLARLYSELTP